MEVRAAKIRFQELSAAQMRKRWPQVNFEGIEWGIFEPECGYLDARASCLAVVEAFVAAGGKAGVGSVNAHVGSRTFTISAKGRPWQAVVTVYASAAEPHTYYSFIDLTNLP